MGGAMPPASARPRRHGGGDQTRRLILLVAVAFAFEVLVWWLFGGAGRGLREVRGSSSTVGAAEGVWIPRWIVQTQSDGPLLAASADGSRSGRLRVLEVFTQLQDVPTITWRAADRGRYLVIPEVRPAGWVPVTPLSFDCPALHWYNKPSRAAASAAIDPDTGHLRIHAGRGTNFWQGVPPERCRDDAHFLHLEMPQYREEALVASGRFRLDGKHEGDQIGVMVRRGPGAWATLGIVHSEASRGAGVSAVVTNEGHSDVVVLPCPGDVGGGGGGGGAGSSSPHRCHDLTLRISIAGDTLTMEANAAPDEDGGAWTLLRRAELFDEGEEAGKHILSVGTFAAAPERDGMAGSIGYFSVMSAPSPSMPTRK